MGSILQFQSVFHHYKDKPILTDFSCTFQVGQITAILGRSGSGKTTLLQLMNGMVKPNTGEIRVLGQPIDYSRVDSLRLQIGYVIQQAGLFPHMTVAENIGVLGNIQGQPKGAIKERIHYLIQLVKLPESYVQKYPHQLSGGEQQRVGIARALFLNPPIVLMDEPFASLDYETKREIYQHLKHIQSTEPRTIILVTHDWDEAALLADRFICLENGAMKATGDRQTLKEIKSKTFDRA